jgi:hypothetical protein
MLQRLLNNKFTDLAGTQIEGQIVLSDALMNEVIKIGLQEMSAPPAETTVTETVAADAPAVNPRDLLAALTIDKLNYRTENGKTIIEVKAGV